MKKQTIAIVGANRGIGYELTKQYTEAGNSVYAFCREVSDDLKALAGTHTNLKITESFEVTNSEQMNKTLKNLNLNSDFFDALVHVSGIYRSDSLEELPENDLIEQFKVNSLAPIYSTKAFLPFLKEPSTVGLVTSRMGSIADNTSGGMYGYRMSKAALNMAGKSLAEDLKAQDITILLLHPGYVKTDMTDHQGHITAKESAQGLIQIMTEKTIEDTGTFWHVNGEPLPW